MDKQATEVASLPRSGGEMPDFEELLAKGSFHARLAKARVAREKALANDPGSDDDFILPAGRKPWEGGDSRPEKRDRVVDSLSHSAAVLKPRSLKPFPVNDPVEKSDPAKAPPPDNRDSAARPETEPTEDDVVALPAVIEKTLPAVAPTSQRGGRIYAGFAIGIVLGASAMALALSLRDGPAPQVIATEPPVQSEPPAQAVEITPPVQVAAAVPPIPSPAAPPVLDATPPAHPSIGRSANPATPTAPATLTAPVLALLAVPHLPEPDTYLSAPAITSTLAGMAAVRGDLGPGFPTQLVDTLPRDARSVVDTELAAAIPADLVPAVPAVVIGRPSISGNVAALAALALPEPRLLEETWRAAARSQHPMTQPALVKPSQHDGAFEEQPLPAAFTAPDTVTGTSPDPADVPTIPAFADFPGTVYLHAPAKVAEAEVADIAGRIAAAGFSASDPKRVDFRVSKSNVRYFHSDDAFAARALAELIGAQARDFTSFTPTPPPGTIEVWLAGTGGSDGTSVARTPSRRAKGNAANRGTSSLMQLRNRLIRHLRNGDHL